MAPTYISKCLHFDLKHSSFLSMLPYIGIVFVCFVIHCIEIFKPHQILAIAIIYNVAGFVADIIIGTGVSVTVVRKMFQVKKKYLFNFYFILLLIVLL
jgi:hypothetical protein